MKLPPIMEPDNCTKELIRLIEEYRTRSVIPGSETSLLLDRIIQNAEYAGRIAPHFDFRNIKCNGIRSLIKHSESYFRVALKKSGNICFVSKFAHVVRTMDLWFQAITHDVCLDFQDCTPEQQISFYGKIFVYDEKAACLLLGHHFLCINMPGIRAQSDLILRLLVLLKTDGMHQMHRYLSLRSKSLARHASKAFPGLKVSDFTHFFSFVSSAGVSAASTAFRSVMAIRQYVSAKEYKIRIPHIHQLHVDKEKMSVSVHNCRVSDTVVTIRILRKKVAAAESGFSGKLVLYAHGGAFMLPSTIAAENVYLKDMAYAIHGTPILSVCVTISQFPTGMQQLLDTYLWLLSDDPRVKEIIGFKPLDIVFSGESSGGNQVLSLLVLLNELHVPRPKSIVIFFPKTSLQRDVFPSLLLSQFDAFANKAMLSAACLSYVPIVRREEDGTVRPVTDAERLPLHSVTDPRYLMVESCILSPIRYPKLHELRDTSLHIMALENDPLLDESIQLAKRWHGPVHLECMENVAHGALLFHYASREGRVCVKLASEMMCRALRE